IVGFGFSAVAIALTWLSIEMTPTTPIWRLVLPFVLMGIGMAFIWSPLAATATRNLPPEEAGAGSGVYNATRQVGGVLGSAGMAAFMTSQISAAIPAAEDPGVGEGSVTRLPGFLHEPFSTAFSQSLLLPAFVALFGVIAALFLRGFGDGQVSAARRGSTTRFDDARLEPDYFPDDDDYVEYAVEWTSEDGEAEGQAQWDELRHAVGRRTVVVPADESVTEPLAVHVEHPMHAPAETWHGGPTDTWHSLMEDDPVQPHVDSEPDTVPELIVVAEPLRAPQPVPPRNEDAPWRSILDELLEDSARVPTWAPEPIGFARNGFHHDAEDKFQVLPPAAPRGGRHSRGEDGGGDAGTYGRHSMPFRD
ncbi:MAG: MFS transporter, partial [Mycobacterium sp.]